LVPEGPGLGVELDESVLAESYTLREIRTGLGADGPVVGQ
jgi:hypothetical protein